MSAQIIAPIPGIFYRRPAPDKDPFVEVGDTVEAGQTIGVIEIMKQFTEVRSDTAGVVSSFEVEDNGMVGPGDVIAVIAEA
ncbi:biotin carboxyl carrier domain-containing protein [Pseudoclavibacter chungangensis]|uniref:Biotin carboxyl carrier protein of acetyl-CoA carboxylase n=1 Tax=Pseudoclavibacter chungangensis TaxID=587635 RepID=A0A7J5BTX2_9MICO|nr:acetyl-CoA carboxylase [Pseudoclavibacter chungangensis]KAB1657761.1 biotin carboxyl carrier domain-containing protein [Pseudoclavibacter chungangensis]NYJ66656.1 biotin carboxyl carrier protein [Pseudoclavibacter chungangensis]